MGLGRGGLAPVLCDQGFPICTGALKISALLSGRASSLRSNAQQSEMHRMPLNNGAGAFEKGNQQLTGG